MESIDHIFAGCTELIDIWRRWAIRWNVQLPNQLSIISLISWADSITLRGGQRKAFDAVILTIFWCIWNFRNSTVFGMVTPRKSFLFVEIVDRAFFWIPNRCSKTKFGWTPWSTTRL